MKNVNKYNELYKAQHALAQLAAFFTEGELVAHGIAVPQKDAKEIILRHIAIANNGIEEFLDEDENNDSVEGN